MRRLHFVCREIDGLAEEIAKKDDFVVHNLQIEKNKWMENF